MQESMLHQLLSHEDIAVRELARWVISLKDCAERAGHEVRLRVPNRNDEAGEAAAIKKREVERVKHAIGSVIGY